MQLQEQLTKATKAKKESKALNSKYYKELNKRNAELYKLKSEKFGYHQIKKDLKKFKFFTGVSPKIFEFVYELIGNNVKGCVKKFPKKIIC